MVNMNVAYARPDRALLTLRDEVYAVYNYTPARASEFVTGYKSPTNFTGHNADANGIVHAIDIFTDDFGNLPQIQGRELAEILRIIGQNTNKFSYLIHDMSEGDPWPAIAGQFNNWVWQTYNGASPHSDHIHVSMCDMYWGDPAPVSASVYDSTAPWGIATIGTAGGSITPIEEDDMYSDADRARDEALANLVKEGIFTKGGQSMIGGKALQFQINDVPSRTWWETTVTRDGEKIPVIQELADVKTLVIGQQAQISGLIEVVKQLASSNPQIDVNAVQEVVEQAVRNSLKGLAGATVSIQLAPTEEPPAAQ